AKILAIRLHASRGVQLRLGRRLDQDVAGIGLQSGQARKGVLAKIRILELPADDDQPCASGKSLERVALRRGTETEERGDIGARRQRRQRNESEGECKNSTHEASDAMIARVSARRRPLLKARNSQ